MKKSTRISALVQTLETDAALALDAHYQGYFTCFNRGEYYEAHDVLEQLWLVTPGENHRFFKGLIQIAGAFVHLRKQYLRPDHPKDGQRLRPAVRLFRLGASNIEGFFPQHLHLDIGSLLKLCAQFADAVTASEFTRNPWSPDRLPQIELQPA